MRKFLAGVVVGVVVTVAVFWLDDDDELAEMRAGGRL